MWSSLVKIQYTELKLCGNDPVVKNSIYSDLDLWPNDPKINRFLLLPQGNHVAKFGKDPIYRTKVIVRKPVWTPAIPNHIIRPVSRRAYKKYGSPIRGLVSLEGDNLVVFYYLSTSEIWLDKRSDLWWEGPYKRETIVLGTFSVMRIMYRI
jgi:hypothetical protein